MRRFALTLFLACLWIACRNTTSPNVPKHDIEEKANTKIPDTGASDAGAAKGDDAP